MAALVDATALAPTVTGVGASTVGQMQGATSPTAAMTPALVGAATATGERLAAANLTGAQRPTTATMTGTTSTTATIERS